jgi:hypothetical protein
MREIGAELAGRPEKGEGMTTSMIFKIQVVGNDGIYRLFFVPGKEVIVSPLTPEEEEEYTEIGWLTRKEWWDPVNFISSSREDGEQ